MEGDRHGVDGAATVRNGDVKAAALLHVTAANRSAEAISANRVELIKAARSFGATWAEIGVALGVSRQTAHKRFGPYVD